MKPNEIEAFVEEMKKKGGGETIVLKINESTRYFNIEFRMIICEILQKADAIRSFEKLTAGF